jgi:hypothetical protein
MSVVMNSNNNFIASANVNLLNEENVDRFFSLYKKLFENLPPEIVKGKEWMFEDFKSAKECPYDWRLIDVQLPLDNIEQILQKTGILQLRPIDKNCRTLIPGCGNHPIVNSGGDPISHDDPYRKIHAHRNAITVNPFLAANPTLVGFFGAQKFPMLEDGQIDLLVIEGTAINNTELGQEELKRIVNPQGQAVANFSDKSGREFSWADNDADCWEAGYVLPPVIIEDLNIFESFNYPDDL